jgi:hypothetical protein
MIKEDIMENIDLVLYDIIARIDIDGFGIKLRWIIHNDWITHNGFIQ